MDQRESLRFLGKPDVRNAILLSEIGVLIHDLGKVSAEFVAGEGAFHSHLVLRRLTRGKDNYIGPEPSPWSAVTYALKVASLLPEERLVAEAILSEIADSECRDTACPDVCSETLDAILGSASARLSTHDEAAFERVAGLARETWSGFVRHLEREEAIGGIEPPFIGVKGFYRELDQLPFVADLLEMGGRTWHPMESQPPEVKLLRAIHAGEETSGPPRSRCDPRRLADVRNLWCEVLANQFLEINNIRKDGPGDLSSWFWKARLCAGEETATALLGDHDRGTALGAEERESVLWLGVRPISRWACSKIIFDVGRDRVATSLWDHCWTLSALYKSSIAQALISGNWPEGDELSWYRLRVRFPAGDLAGLTAVKELIEVEYPLGNELFRTAAEASFAFPGLDSDLATSVLDELRLEMGRLFGTETLPELQLSPLSTEDAYRLVAGSTT
jgi:hypothetical protein